MKSVVFLDAATTELVEAGLYYETQLQGLGERFAAAVQRTAQMIADYPEAGPLIRGNVRRRLVPNFPYGLLYRIEPEGIVIVAVMHLRRRADYWVGRG